MERPIIGHVVRSYLPQSETFIWQYLNSFKHFFPVVITRSLENLDQFRLPGGRLRAISGPRGSIPWFIDNCYRRILQRPYGYIERILTKEKIHLVHAHFGYVGFDCLPACISLNIPLITTFYGHDLSVKDFIDRMRLAYAQLFRAGNYFLVEGPFMRQKLISLGCPSEKIFIQRIALDLRRYTFKTRSWDGKRRIRFLFAGRFVEKKGLEYALEALAKIKRKGSFEFRIIGGGELEEGLRSLASNLGLTTEIVWLGIQPHKSLIEELQNCDILIQPSVTAENGDTEGGAPTIILEAQACGIPIISTNHADIPYITTANGSALLSPERDVNALADNIHCLLDNPSLWSAMGQLGREHVEKLHDINKEVLALGKIYESCIAKR